MPVDRSGRVYVVGSVPVLHPEAQTVNEMLEGWRNQQLCRNWSLRRSPRESGWSSARSSTPASSRGPGRRRWWTSSSVTGARWSGKQSTIRGYECVSGSSAPMSAIPTTAGTASVKSCSALIPPRFSSNGTPLGMSKRTSSPREARIHQTRVAGFLDHADDQVARSPRRDERVAAGLPGATMFKVAYSYGLFSGAPAACVSAIL